MRISCLSFLFILLFVLVFQSHSQQLIKKNDYGFGGKLSLDFNSMSQDIRQLPSIPDSIPWYATGNKAGFSIGGFFEIPVSKRVSLILALSYYRNNSSVFVNVPTIFKSGTKDTSLTVSHLVSSNLSSIRFDPVIKYNLIYDLNLIGGISLGYLLNKSFYHQETIQNPGSLSFADGTKQRQADKEIQAVKDFQASFVVGLAYDILLDKLGNSMLSFETSYLIGYSDITDKISFDLNTFRISASYKYFLDQKQAPKEEKAPEPEKEPEIIVKEGSFVATPEKDSISINITDASDKSQKKISSINLEEFATTNFPSLLNYIFFDNNSADIPTRYALLSKPSARAFNEKNLSDTGSLYTYYNILNIIGKRLKDNPESSITLTGCNSDAGNEKNNTELSEKRAVAVSSYLTDIWEIDNSRIKIKARNLPEKFSKQSRELSNEENQRVEIIADDETILAPISSHDTIKEVFPKIIRFIPYSSASWKKISWTLIIKQAGKVIKIFDGTGTTPIKIDWMISNDYAKLSKDKLDISYEVKDLETNLVQYKNTSLSVKYLSLQDKERLNYDDTRLDKYSLILFDFDKYSPNENAKKLIEKINNKIAPNSKIVVEGFTDMVGDSLYNQELSKNRAKAVAKMLNHKDVQYYGYGESFPLFDNQFPEGRFYCRTVRIKVETKKK